MRKVPGYDVFIDDDGVVYRFERVKKGISRCQKARVSDRLYQVSMHKDRDGYLTFVCETDDGKPTALQYHRAKALAYIPNPENKPTVDHENRNKADNRLSNLKWATYKEQALNKDKTIAAFEINGVHEREDRKAYDCVKYRQKVSAGFRYRKRPDGSRGWVFVGA